jgi:hypothetical protein
VEFLLESSAGALFLDPGLGKTSIVLAAFSRLQRNSKASGMLVVAPLRVCQTVWRQEAAKWEQFRDLTFAFAHGDKKADALASKADITLINPEGIAWLAEYSYFPWDTVVIDELTKFKNASSQRHKALRPLLKHARRRWGLTGTPAPNGMLDLFGQFLLLDDGAALGRFITHYRLQYFVPGYNGFEWKLQPNGQARIEERIKPYVLRMAAEDYLTLPPLVDDVREVELPPKALLTYKSMRDDMLAELPGGVVTAQNAGGVANKLKQMAGGFVYRPAGEAGVAPPSQDTQPYEVLHSAKIEAVADLVEELAGQPLLLAYEFNADLARLLEKFPETPYLGAGVTAKRTQEIVDAWNRGDVPLLLAHPKSAGHGLNLQGSGCGHVAWFGPTYDLELYEQFIDRVLRQGNTSQRVMNHIFVAKGTIDEQVLKIVREKGTTQTGLLQRLGAAITQESSMEKLGTQDGKPIVPRGWGPPMQLGTAEQKAAAGRAFAEQQTTGATPQQVAQAEALAEAAKPKRTKVDEAKQKEAIKAKIDGSQPQPDRAAAAKAMFSPSIQKALEGDDQVSEEMQTAIDDTNAKIAVAGREQQFTAAAYVTDKAGGLREATASDLAPPIAPEIDYDKLASAIVRNVAARFLG